MEGGSGYFLSGVELRLVGCHRDLGVTVDCSLKFHHHIDSIVRKAAGLANQLLRATVCRDEFFMVSLFVSHYLISVRQCGIWVIWGIWRSWRVSSVDGRSRLRGCMR